MNQNGRSQSQVFHVACVSSHGESLKKLAKLNPDWNLSPEDIVAGGKAGQKIYRLKFINRPVELRKNRDTGTLDVYIADQILGYIHPNEADQAKEILKNCEIQNIACGIWGGQCKVVDEFYDVDTQQAPLTVNLKIVYTDPAPIEDDFNDLIFDDPAPARTPAVPTKSMPREEKPAKASKKRTKKPIFKRWWFWAIIVVVALMLFGGSGAEEEVKAPSNSGSNNQAAAVKEDETQGAAVPQATTPAVPLADSGTLGDFDVQIHDYTIADDYAGDSAIIISYTFTNNSDENASASVNLICSAYQNGVELESAYLTDDSIHSAGDSLKDVQPGASMEITEAFKLTSDTAPVEFEVSEAFAFSDDMLGKVYEISEGGTTVLRTAPTGSVSGDINGFEVCIVSYKLVEDYEGKDAILFELGYTNNNDETYNFLSTINFTPFQDGVELEMAILSNESENTGHSMLNVRPGAGIPLAFAYLLTSDTTPIEVEITDAWGFSNDVIETTIDIA